VRTAFPRGSVRWLVAALIVVPAAQLVAQDATPPVTTSTAQPSAFRSFVGDVFHDYWNFVASADNARLAAGGVILAATVHFNDHKWSDEASPTVTPAALTPGATYGNLAFQFPLGITWWIIGHVAGSDRAADAGRDIVRAQISGASWAYLLKYSVNRTRPNGDPRSFPSGHATASFATERKHWPSDVVFGAALGTISGRTVTLHVRRERLTVQPHAVPGGGALIVHVQR
jgi:hypothetical protein